MKIYWTPRIYQASLTCNNPPCKNPPVHTNYKRIAPRRALREQKGQAKCNVNFLQLPLPYFGLGLFVSTVGFPNNTFILYGSYLCGLRYL